MSKWIRSLPFIFSILPAACGQNKAPEERPHCENPAFDAKVAGMLQMDVPVIGVQELRNIQDEVHIFDARKRAEYEVSHIPGARYLGFDDFDPERLEGLPKDAPIVLYCSIGYRSEKIGEKLEKMGYTRVYNLFGSLFEWANRGFPMVDGQGRPTKAIHTYNKNWSKWVDDQKADKTW